MQNRISTLSDLVRFHIQEAILKGNLVPGQRIKETELVAELKISRSPIREAIKVLVDEGLIVNEPWKGLSIAKLTRLQMLEIFAYREVLEGMAVELACENISSAQLQQLEELVGDHMLAEEFTLADLARNNQEFHQHIYEASGNEFLMASVGTLRTLLALLPKESFRKAGRTKSIQTEHRAIVNALKKKDAVAAKSAILLHVHNSAQAHMSLIIEADLGLI